MKKAIGIVGGMGPLATCDLMQKIISQTQAARDQEHIRIYVDNNTSIPDRTAAILSGAPSPVPALIESGRKLVDIGAELLLMPCNTAHFFYDDLQAAVRVPVLHMPLETGKTLREMGVCRAGVLATEGTVKSGIYEKALLESGVRAIYPDPAGQEMITRMIYTYVKAGREGLEQLPVEELLTRLRGEGAEILLLACTELPIAFGRLGITEGTLDPTLVLARAAVREAGYPLRNEKGC